MPDLNFQIESASVVEFAAVPMLGFKLVVTNSNETERIQSVALRCQIQLEVTRRNYTPAEKEKLADLFGEPGRWGQTLRPMLWTHVQTVVRGFTGSTSMEVQVPCTFDFNVAATKYFYALEAGDIPLCLMFSGTVYETGEDGAVTVSPISWEKETRFRLPVSIWRKMMDEHYPNTAWVCLRRDVFDRIHEYKVQNGIPTWERALDKLLDEVAKVVPV